VNATSAAILKFLSGYPRLPKDRPPRADEIAPTLSEIAKAMQMSRGAIQYQLGILKDAGKVDWEPGVPRTLVVVK
jgi:DNA-binding transcriptional ArsR family regulator